VFCISVANAHCYYVRVQNKGILVSNCDSLRYGLATYENETQNAFSYFSLF
jgi:hypothetical protein